MPYPEVLLNRSDRQTEVLFTEHSMRLLAHCALKHADYEVGLEELETTLRSTNSYLPMPLDDLEARQRRYINAALHDVSFTPEAAKAKRLDTDAALAFCLRSVKEVRPVKGYGRERIYNDLEAYNVRLPMPIDQLVDNANFEPFCRRYEGYSRPTQAVVLTKKVIGMLIRSETLPNAKRAWRARVDIGEKNPDGSKAPLREIMYGYDGDDPHYSGLDEGSLVVVALPGARLLRPDGRMDKLRRRHWRNFGIESNGMLCSKREACDLPLMHFVQGKGWEQDTVLTLRSTQAHFKGASIRTIRELKQTPKTRPILEIQMENGHSFYQGLAS